jgi:hypothetical protein
MVPELSCIDSAAAPQDHGLLVPKSPATHLVQFHKALAQAIDLLAVDCWQGQLLAFQPRSCAHEHWMRLAAGNVQLEPEAMLSRMAEFCCPMVAACIWRKRSCIGNRELVPGVEASPPPTALAREPAPAPSLRAWALLASLAMPSPIAQDSATHSQRAWHPTCPPR